MFMIRYCFCCISHCFTHFRWKIQAEFCLKDISDTALTGLTVNTDYICVIVSANIFRINWKIRYIPVIRIFVISPVHTFGNRILMRTGECSKYKGTTVWTSFTDFHSCAFFVYLTDMWHIGEVKFRIYSLGIHIHAKCDDIHITGTFTISE